MKRAFKGTCLVLTAVVLANFLPGVSTAGPLKHPRKIIVFKSWYNLEEGQDSLLKFHGTEKIKRLRLINGTAVFLSPQAESALLGRDEILRIDDDLLIRSVEVRSQKKGKPEPGQMIPWGIDRINADLAWPVTVGRSVKVGVMDSGIDLDHPDLLENIAGSMDFINPKKPGEDHSGHGSHVAGTIAAMNNDIGVIGTGPGISLYSLKVLDNKTRGYLSDLIEALDWCIKNDIQVVNMSFGSSSDNESFHEAITQAHAAGITMVAAAGNNGESRGLIEYPAKYSETIAVSAVDEGNQIAYFSSFGEDIDIAAPGNQIYSTSKNGSYDTKSGTSMAAPHVTGTVALILTTVPGSYDLDGDGAWDPEEVRAKLIASAENLGLSPDFQGAGLVRADEAIK